MNNVVCDEKKYFFCQTPKIYELSCPKYYFPYKGKCLYKSEFSGTLWENKEICALHGGIVLPIKTKGQFEFIKSHAKASLAGNIYLGMNNTDGKMMQTDKTEYTSASYDFNGDSVKFGRLQCVYLKKGIGYLPREDVCEKNYESYCQWIGEILIIHDSSSFKKMASFW